MGRVPQDGQPQRQADQRCYVNRGGLEVLAVGDAEFLAFLRKLPDGRYAAAAPQYDASGAFRLLSYPTGAQFYPVPNTAKVELPAK